MNTTFVDEGVNIMILRRHWQGSLFNTFFNAEWSLLENMYLCHGHRDDGLLLEWKMDVCMSINDWINHVSHKGLPVWGECNWCVSVGINNNSERKYQSPIKPTEMGGLADTDRKLPWYFYTSSSIVHKRTLVVSRNLWRIQFVTIATRHNCRRLKFVTIAHHD